MIVLENKEVLQYIQEKELNQVLVDGYIEKQIEFGNFESAFDYMKQVAKLCQVHNHHPYWINDYDTVIIKFQTIDLCGITEKDLVLAEEIDRLN